MTTINPINDAHQWSVMLADTARCDEDTLRQLASLGHTFDIKWDGERALTIIDNGRLTLRNRKGEDFTFRYPELVAAAAREFEGVSCVLDSELLIFDPQTGVPRFGLTGKRRFGPGRTADIKRMSDTMPATLVAFDMLAVDTFDIRSQPQVARLNRLDSLVPEKAGPGRRIVRSIRSDDGVLLMRLVKAQKLEGVIAKQLGAPYRAGRRNAWLKIKPTSTVTAIVTGYDAGEGWRSDTFGALHIAVLDGSDLVPIGKVGSGFKVTDLAVLDPFVKAGADLLVEVEYQERQPGTGVLRFPRFKGVRWDLHRADANVGQFAAEARQ